MPMNQYVAPFQQSGSSNVPMSESTGGQLQNAPIGDVQNLYAGPASSGQAAGTAGLNEVSNAFLITLGASGSNPTATTLVGTAPGVQFQSGVTTSVLLSGASVGGGVSQIAGASISGSQIAGLAIQGVVPASGIGLSGFFGAAAASIFAVSGAIPSGSMNSATWNVVTTNSGVFGPTGFFALQILGLSGGAQYFKVPFFNS